MPINVIDIKMWVPLLTLERAVLFLYELRSIKKTILIKLVLTFQNNV